VFRELQQEAFTSTAATLGNEELFAKIINIRYDGRSKSAVDLVVGLDQMYDQYNEQQLDPAMRVNDMMMKTFMRTAVAEVSMLLDVNNQEKQAIARGAPVFGYRQYFDLLKSAAAQYDRRRASCRTANIAELESSAAMTESLVDYFVNKVSRRTPGSTMDKACWDSLEPETHTVLDMLPDHEKAKIIQDSAGRLEQAKAKAKAAISANHTEVVSDSLTEMTEALGEGTESDPISEAPAFAEINAAVAKARSEAHPGDTR